MKIQQLTALLWIVLITVSLQSNGSVTTRKAYYASMQFMESPFSDFKGIVPLTIKEATQRNHYLFEYDSRDNLKRISFRLGNVLRAPNHTANYFFHSSRIDFEYSPGQEIRTFYDQFNQQISIRGGVFREIYSLDKLGHRTMVRFEDKESRPVENNWNIARYAWTLQTNGAVIEERYNLKGELVPMRPDLFFYRVRFHFGYTGSLALMQQIDDMGNLVENQTGVAQDRILYDKMGRWYGWAVLDKNHQLTEGNGPAVAQGIYPANAWGYESFSWHVDRHGKPLASKYGFWGSSTSFDSRGNMVKRTFLDSLQNPGPHLIAGYTHMRITWDKTGLLQLATELLDGNYSPIEHRRTGYAYVRHAYDRKRRMVRTTFHDKTGQLINRKDNGVAYLHYHYQPDGSPTIIRYNKEGKEL